MSDKVIVRSALKDNRNFTEMPDLRKGIIEEAPDTPIIANFAVNSVANLLHPQTQHLKVKQVAELRRNTRVYVLEPDTESGTAKLSYFRPGQQININIENGEEKYCVPFTICSSPGRTTKNEYLITVTKDSDNPATTFILDNWKKGTQVCASAPFGVFYYQALRDCNHITAICDSIDYEPFLSMAEAINDGTLNVDMTLLFAARKQSEIIMAERFDELAQNKHFRIIYVFSDEHVFKCERGFITKTLIEKYSHGNKYSLFISGSEQFCSRTAPQIAELGLEQKNIRYKKTATTT